MIQILQGNATTQAVLSDLIIYPLFVKFLTV